MAPSDSLARLRNGVLDRVTCGGVTVARACREAGISRARYYQRRRRYLAHGEAGLRPKPHPVRPTRQLPPPLVDAILSYAIFHAGEGERSIAQALRLGRFGSWQVSHGGVRYVLRRAGLGRRLARRAAAEALSAAEGGPLTERALREIRAIERPTIMHIGSDTVGAELFADTMSVGKRKGVGPVWQYPMVDGACSFGFARVRAGRKSATSMARFLIEDVAPVYREATLRLVRSNTDGGPEFGRAFTRACLELGIEHHKLPPRSPDPQRPRRAVPGQLPAPPLPDRVPLPLLHRCRRHRRRPWGLAAPLQLRAATPRLPHRRTSAGRALLRASTGSAEDERMGSR